jgi:hypothetical protein
MRYKNLRRVALGVIAILAVALLVGVGGSAGGQSSDAATE